MKLHLIEDQPKYSVERLCCSKQAILLNDVKHCIYIHTCIYIYIYIFFFFKKKQRNQSQRIINLFPSCYAFLKFSKTRKKINRTSSDQLDKKTRVDT